MPVRCVAASGSYASNRHDDRFSSNGALVQQRGCLVLAQGERAVLNFTFTQNVLNGLNVMWDPAPPPAAGSPPGAGLEVAEEAHCPACPGGVHVLFTPILLLGGSYVRGGGAGSWRSVPTRPPPVRAATKPARTAAGFERGAAELCTPPPARTPQLANYVETHNTTSAAAPLRREWFATFVAGDVAVNPAATACAGALSARQLADYHQARAARCARARARCVRAR